MNASQETKLLQAILYMLISIRDYPEVGWYCGHGTEMFRLLTEAYAALTDCPVDTVRARYLPQNARDPEEKKEL